MSTVFISYRRENTAGEARALFNDLIARLGENSVFMDVDSIALGRDFRSVLQETTASCDLMLVLIGRNWVEAKDEGGRIRLQNPADYVRLEIDAALKRDIAVTPVLVQGAGMPADEDLPAEIRTWRTAMDLNSATAGGSRTLGKWSGGWISTVPGAAVKSSPSPSNNRCWRLQGHAASPPRPLFHKLRRSGSYLGGGF